MVKRSVKQSGYIYCMVNPCIHSSIVKVGCTARTPSDRLKESNSKHRKNTWIPPTKYIGKGFARSQYTCAYFKKVKNHPKDTETRLHQLLQQYGNRRIHPRREFFETTVDDVRSLLKIIHYDNIIEAYEKREAELTKLLAS